MPITEDDQPQEEDSISPADILAVDLLFKRIAERGRRIRRQQADNQQEEGDKQTKEKST